MQHHHETGTFTAYLSQFLGKDDTAMALLIEKAVVCFKPVLLKKNEFLVAQDDICKYFCYIESGILQHALGIDGEEKTTYLALRNTVTASLNSFLNRQPSRKSVKAIADCRLWVIELGPFKALIAENAAFREFYYNIIERQICLIDDYRIDLLTLSPEERYRKLLATEPNLLQQVPLHYLASFLGISTRHMSRIRASTLKD